MGQALKDTQYYCYGDYLTWPDDSRYELIDGQAYAMLPAPDLAHQDIAGEIYLQARLALKNKPCRAFIAPVDVRLPKHNEADQQIDTVVQPDVLVVCDSSKLDRRGVRGAPDWIVEVLSPGTASHDQIRKRLLYERSGVKEYWLVHPTDRLLTVYRLNGAEYGKPELSELTGASQVGVLPDIIIHWGELSSRLPDPDAY
jgi:Uma2 family endonuclease